MEGLTQFDRATEYFILWRDSRVFNISFTYRFGKAYKAGKRSGGSAGDEMQPGRERIRLLFLLPQPAERSSQPTPRQRIVKHPPQFVKPILPSRRACFLCNNAGHPAITQPKTKP